MPPASMWRTSAVLAARLSVRSGLRASGGTASTEPDRSAKVTACVFTVDLSVRRGSTLLLRRMIAEQRECASGAADDVLCDALTAQLIDSDHVTALAPRPLATAGAALTPADSGCAR